MSDLALDPRDLGRLKWRCRRGLLENDLLIERFENEHELRVSGMDRVRNLNLIADGGYRLIKTCINPPRALLRIGEPRSSTATTPPWNRARRGNSSQNDGPLS